MAVIDYCFNAMNGSRQPSMLAENATDSVSREQIAVAARLLRTISVTDGDVEILLHEMARALAEIDWDDLTEAAPAFLCAISMPLTFSHGTADLHTMDDRASQTILPSFIPKPT